MPHRRRLTAVLLLVCAPLAGSDLLHAQENRAGIVWTAWKKDPGGKEATRVLWKETPLIERYVALQLGVHPGKLRMLNEKTGLNFGSAVQKTLEALPDADEPVLYFFLNSHGGVGLIEGQKHQIATQDFLEALLKEIDIYQRAHAPRKVTLTIAYSACHAGSMQASLAAIPGHEKYRINLFMSSSADDLGYDHDLLDALVLFIHNPPARALWDSNRNGIVDPEELGVLGALVGSAGLRGSNFQFYSTYLPAIPPETLLGLYEFLVGEGSSHNLHILAAAGIRNMLASDNLRPRLDPGRLAQLVDKLSPSVKTWEPYLMGEAAMAAFEASGDIGNFEILDYEPSYRAQAHVVNLASRLTEKEQVEKAAPVLAWWLKTSGSPDVRLDAANVLEALIAKHNMNPAPFINSYLTALDDPNFNVMANAAEILCGMDKTVGAIPSLRPALEALVRKNSGRIAGTAKTVINRLSDPVLPKTTCSEFKCKCYEYDDYTNLQHRLIEPPGDEAMPRRY